MFFNFDCGIGDIKFYRLNLIFRSRNYGARYERSKNMGRQQQQQVKQSFLKPTLLLTAWTRTRLIRFVDKNIILLWPLDYFKIGRMININQLLEENMKKPDFLLSWNNKIINQHQQQLTGKLGHDLTFSFSPSFLLTLSRFRLSLNALYFI